MIQIHAATRIRLQFDGVVVGQGRAGGIGAVRAIGDKHDVAVALAAMLVVRLDDHQAGDLAVRARRWLQRHPLHPGDLGQIAFQFIEQLDRALGHALVLQRMNPREARQARHFFVHLGVVFHRAGSQRDRSRYPRQSCAARDG